MKKIWINKSNSFKDAEKFDIEYYLKMSPTERLDILQLLRELDFKTKKRLKNESRKRLHRVYKIIEQK